MSNRREFIARADFTPAGALTAFSWDPKSEIGLPAIRLCPH